MKFSIITLGCKVNQFESEFFINSLIERGFKLVKLAENPDLIIVNSCTVTNEAKRQSLQLLRKSKKLNPNSKIIITGCVVDEIKNIKDADLTISNYFKYKLPDLIEKKGKFVEDIFKEKNCKILKVKKFYNTTRGFLKIQDGCNNFCSYCKIIHVRGKPRSVPEDIVISKILELSKSIKEIVLCGINIELYGIDFGKKDGFVNLLYKIEDSLISKKVKNFRIRLSSLKPDKLNEKLIKLISKSEYFCPHFHLSIQNFNDEVLKLMNRKYNFTIIDETVNLIRENISLANIGADLITGFPNETEERFLDNLEKMKNIDINYFHIFPFSKKIGTEAYNFEEKIDKKEKKRRLNILKETAKIKKEKFLRKNLNIVHRVLIETEDTGYSDNYLKFRIKIDSNQLKNRFVNVIGHKVIDSDTIGGEII